MSIPFRSRFRIVWERQGRRFYLRIVFGVIVLYIARQWPDYSAFQLTSQVQIGWIPRKIEIGQSVPAWTPWKHVHNSQQPWWYAEKSK